MFCTKCGKETDGKSNFCNYCGATLNNQTSVNTQQVNQSRRPVSHSVKVKKKVYQQWWFWVIIVILGLAVIVNMGSSENENKIASSNTTESNTVQTSSEPAPEEIMEVDYTVLYQEYQDNAIAADAKYKGKILKLTGEVYNIDREILGNTYITFNIGGQYSIKNVRITFKKSEESKVAQLKKGQKVTIKGKCTGTLVSTTVALNDCEIIE